jgi:hypothetical protein
MTFAKPMKTTDIIIRFWNNDAASRDTEVVNAFQVEGTLIGTGSSTAKNSNIVTGNPTTSSAIPPVSQSLNISNSKTASNTIPSTNSNSMPTLMDETKEWAGYSPVSISDSELLADMGLKGNHIPQWFMKSTSKWFVNGNLDQQEFVSAIKYMYDKGIIK